MKKLIVLIGIVIAIVIVGYLDAPPSDQTNYSNYYYYEEEVNDTVSAFHDQSRIPTYSSLETVLENTHEEDGYIIETYREYEIYRDTNDVIVKRLPTPNFHYLKYKIDQD